MQEPPQQSGSTPPGQTPGSAPSGEPPQGYAPPQGYTAPGYGTPPAYGPARPRANGMAVASLVLGLVGIILFVLFAIPSLLAVIFGIVALRQIAASGGAQGGRGMAIAGVVLGAVEIVLFVVALATGDGNFYFRVG